MSNTNQLVIGLAGFGVVGKGLYDVLQNTPALQAQIKTILIKHPNKPRSIDASYFTTDSDKLLEDPSINVMVELIDDAVAAYQLVKAALQKGKAVVSANKKMIAEHFNELLYLQRLHNVPFLYEAACCASMPIIRNLEEYYDTDLLQSFKGIINGSTNFILTKMFRDGVEFKEALLQAQQAGFAESDPSLDISGADAANKLSILLAHAFGVIELPQQLLVNGIQQISQQDAMVANSKQYTIKLVAQSQKINEHQLAAFVLPQFVPLQDDLYQVNDEFNAVITESSFADKHFFKGKGAGAYPTASAVLSDIAALRHQYKYEYKKLSLPNQLQLTQDYYLKVFVSTNDVTQLPQQDFEWIEEWHNGHQYSWLTGIIHARKLATTSWWKQPGVSLITYPTPIAADVAYKKISKKSLQLAGVV